MNRILLIIVLLFSVPSIASAQNLYDTLIEAIEAEINATRGSGYYTVGQSNIVIVVSKTFPGLGNNGCDLVVSVCAYVLRSSSGNYTYCYSKTVYVNISSPSGKYFYTTKNSLTGFTDHFSFSGNSTTYNFSVQKTSALRSYYSSSDEIRSLYEQFNSNAPKVAAHSLLTDTASSGRFSKDFTPLDIDTIMSFDTDGGGVPDFAELLDQPFKAGAINDWRDDLTCSCNVCCVHECSCGYYWAGASCDGTAKAYTGCDCHAAPEDDRCTCGACCNHSCEQKNTNPDYTKKHYTVVNGEKIECDGTGKTPNGCACHRVCVCGADCFHCCTCSYFNPKDCLGRFKDCECHQDGLCPCNACCKCTCLCGDYPNECDKTSTSCSCHDDGNPDDPCTCGAGCYHCCTCGEFAWDYSKCQKCPCHYECPTCKAKCEHCCTCSSWAGPECKGRQQDCDCHSDGKKCSCGACCYCKCTCLEQTKNCYGNPSNQEYGCKCHDPNSCTCGACCSCKCTCGEWNRETCGKNASDCRCHGCTCDACCGCECTCGALSRADCPGTPEACDCHKDEGGHEKEDWFPDSVWEAAYKDFFDKLKEKIGLDLLELFDVSGGRLEPIVIEYDFGNGFFGGKYEKARVELDIEYFSNHDFFRLIRICLIFVVVLSAIHVCLVVLRQY